MASSTTSTPNIPAASEETLLDRLAGKIMAALIECSTDRNGSADLLDSGGGKGSQMSILEAARLDGWGRDIALSGPDGTHYALSRFLADEAYELAFEMLEARKAYLTSPAPAGRPDPAIDPAATE